jgi:hypothetical protein
MTSTSGPVNVGGTGHHQALDEYGYGQSRLGGSVSARAETFTYTDSTARALFRIPAGAKIIAFRVHVDTAFNDTGTDTVVITGDDGVTYGTGIIVSAVGPITLGFDASKLFRALATEVLMKVTYTGQNGNSSAGVAWLVCEFILP